VLTVTLAEILVVEPNKILPTTKTTFPISALAQVAVPLPKVNPVG
jgi:hypothetical protein